MAGERGDSSPHAIFFGLGIGGIYTLFQTDNLFSLSGPPSPTTNPTSAPSTSSKAPPSAPTAPGVPRRRLYRRHPRRRHHARRRSPLLARPHASAIYFFGAHLSAPLYPGTVLITQMSPSDLWRTYVRPMGAGAVACSGLITLLRTLPTIVGALTQGLKKTTKNIAAALPTRTTHDLPPIVVFGGSLVLILLMFLFLQFKPVPGAQVGALANIAASILVVIFGFLFVTVSARIVGIVGSSASPVSGMTIATLMATAAIFLVKGWTAPAFGALAITIGGIVCIAASNAGDTAQDLKTGYLIGATPWKQQVAIMVGVIISIFSIGATLNAMNKGLESFQRLPKPIPFNLAHLPDGVQETGNFALDHITLTSHNADNHSKEELSNTKSYILLNAIGSNTLDDGKYLYNPATGQIEVQWIQGIGSEKAAAPQGRLMATVINGILSRKLPWTLVLLGVALVIVVELLGVRSLTFAVGAYLSIATTLAIFVGGVMRWMVDRAMLHHRAKQAATKQAIAASFLSSRSEAEGSAVPPAAEPFLDESITIESEEISPGSLYASGLIAAGGIVGLLGVCVKLYEAATDRSIPRFSDHNPLHHDWISVLMFALLAYSLYYFARKPLQSSE